MPDQAVRDASGVGVVGSDGFVGQGAEQPRDCFFGASPHQGAVGQLEFALPQFWARWRVRQRRITSLLVLAGRPQQLATQISLSKRASFTSLFQAVIAGYLATCHAARRASLVA